MRADDLSPTTLAAPIRGGRLLYVTVDLDADLRPVSGQFRGVGVGHRVRFGPLAAARCHCPADAHATVPAADGSCGFYLDAHERGALAWWEGLRRDSACWADVELFGRVVEHGSSSMVEGWRAEKMRVLGVRLPRHCYACDETLPTGQLRAVAHAGWRPEPTRLVEADVTVQCVGCVPQSPRAVVLGVAQLAALVGTEMSWEA